jgi:hypothetical protein
VNTEDVAGVIVSLVGLWLSHKHHAQPATSDGGTHQSAATPAPSSLRHPPSSLPPSASIPTDTVVPRATAAPIQPLAAPKHSDGGSALPVLRSSSEAGSL